MSEVKSEILSWIKTIVFAVVIAVIINKVVIVNATVPTGSMENTIMPNDRVVALRLSYYWGSPDRGDIVVFRYPDNEEVLYIKRVIGLPGETITIRNGKIYINDSTEPFEEDYLKEDFDGSYGPYTVPEGSYFMMGDNRNNSLDSRYWENKFVEEDKILGKVLFKYYKGFEIIK